MDLRRRHTVSVLMRDSWCAHCCSGLREKRLSDILGRRKAGGIPRRERLQLLREGFLTEGAENLPSPGCVGVSLAEGVPLAWPEKYSLPEGSVSQGERNL